MRQSAQQRPQQPASPTGSVTTLLPQRNQLIHRCFGRDHAAIMRAQIPGIENQCSGHQLIQRPAPAAPRIRSAQARTLYDDAVLATKQQDWKAAQRALRGACQLEPESEFLRGKMAQLEQHLRTLR